MIPRDLNNIHNDKGYSIRCTRTLAEQIKKDYAQLTMLFKRLKRGETDAFLIEDLHKYLSWLKQSIKILTKMNRHDIEGVSCGEINHIDQDIIDKEDNLKILLYSISSETEDFNWNKFHPR
jgi:hypothetical protein